MIKTKVVFGTKSILRTLYSPQVKSVAESLGLHSLFKRFYHSLNLPTDEVTEFSANGETILIQPTSVGQRRGIEKYQGAERPVIEDLLSNLRPDDVFYDVGAAFGTYTALVATASPSVTVHAFEPGADRFEQLGQTIELNDADVTSHQVGLSTQDQTHYLSAMGELVDGSDEGVEAVEVVGAGNYITREGIDPPTVLKIDVEGKEMDVIRGMRDAIEQNCRLLYCEMHLQKGVDENEFYDLLESIGFSVEKIHERGSEIFVRAEQ